MKANKKKVLGITATVVVLALIASLVFLRSNYMQHWRERKFLALWEEAIEDAQRRRVLLLCNTDHQALLKAGREILSHVPKDRLNPQPDGRHLGDIGVPSGVDIPQAIWDLNPRGCLASLDGYLTLEMHGGMDHFGVKIYPEDYKKPRDYFKYGDRELLPGLWYYDDGYIHNPEYDKRIDKLINEHRRLVK
ncbi:MAG: hypothetical protein ACYSTT_20645 [Planctomycetota bacterium]|jgi:hypothetical protein